MSDRSDRRNTILLLSSSTLVVVPLAGAELGRAEAHAEDGDQGNASHLSICDQKLFRFFCQVENLSVLRWIECSLFFVRCAEL